MPLLQGEVPLLTLFADCHYYFSPPTSKPLHDRFDKRSYVYLYHDALNRRGRLEIANHAGTPDQDAFHGYLDSADVEYSFKHPTLFTITVQGRVLSNTSPGTSPLQDISQWHLPTSDVYNQGKYMYRLHTVDIYLWTADDAGLFLDSLKRVTAPGQVRILDANVSHPEHRDSMSPVVQQLEKLAVISPTFPPQQQAQRSNSISTTHTNNSVAQAATNALTPVSPPSSPPVEQQQVQQPAAFAPMAYNPAAPAAPEPIAHREKTPPPADAETGTGLMAAATHDHGTAGHQPQHQQYVNPLQQQFSPQPSGGPYTPGFGAMAPHPQPGVQRTNTFGQPYSGTPIAAGMPGPPSQSPFNPLFAAPPTDPNAHLYGQLQQTPTPGMSRQNTLPPSFGPGAASSQPSFGPGAASSQPSFGPGAASSQPSFGPGAPPTQFSGYPSGAPNAQGAQGAPPVSPGFPTGQPSSQPQPYAPSPVQQGQQPVAQYGQGGYGVNHSMHSQVYIPEGATQPVQLPAAQPGQQGQAPSVQATMGKIDKGFSKLFKKLDKKY